MTRRARILVGACVGLVLAPGVVSAGTHATGVIVFAADRKPTVSGEIYRVGLDGRRVDLSRSAADDASPALAPDGRHVAFVSTRGGHVALYLADSNGRHVQRISPQLAASAPDQIPGAEISWSPDSRHLTALVLGSPSRLYLWSADAGWHVVPGTRDAVNQGAVWSPDARLVAFAVARTGEVRVLDAAGKRRWTVAGSAASWSARGRLAVTANSYTVNVYDEAGRQLSTINASGLSWSPNGDRLASVTASGLNTILEVRSGGVGRPTLRRELRGNRPVGAWLGANELRIFGANGWAGYDLVHKRATSLPGAYVPSGSVPYVDGTKAIAEIFGQSPASLELTTRAGRSQVLATAPPCGDLGAFSNLQFVPGGRFVIYATACPAPPADVYAVSPDGTGLRRLTTSTQDDTQPALSPDGRTIAYVEKANAVKCGGCTETIWVMNADGSAARALPNSADPAAELPYDDSPSFSPDGLQLLFTRSGPSAQRLFVEPVAGGAARDLGLSASYPAWGPQRIAFDNGRVSTAAPDGTDLRPATYAGRVLHGMPAWSSDGRLAVLAPGAASVVLTVAEIGAEGRRIALPGLRLPSPPGRPAWSPDRTRLAFAAVDREGIGDVWTVGVDGTGLRRVTHDVGAVSSVGWR